MATVILAAVCAGCILEQGSGGFAAAPRSAGGGESPDAGGEPADDGGGSPDDGDELVEDGGSDSAGTAMNCSALPFGCVCSPEEPTQVSACTTTSVANAAGQRGVCCAGPLNCICVAYECLRLGGGCSCQLTASNAPGTRLEDCGDVTANPAIKCCRSHGQCVCSSADCLLTEFRVSNCSVHDLAWCARGEDSVASCESAGMGDTVN